MVNSVDIEVFLKSSIVCNWNVYSEKFFCCAIQSAKRLYMITVMWPFCMEGTGQYFHYIANLVHCNLITSPSDDENTEDEEEEEQGEQRFDKADDPTLVSTVIIIPELVRQDEDTSDSDDDGPVLYRDDNDEDEEDDQPSTYLFH